MIEIFAVLLLYGALLLLLGAVIGFMIGNWRGDGE